MSLVLLIGSVVAGVGTVSALSPGERCRVRKLGAAGRYASCRLQQDARATKSVRLADFAACDDYYQRQWARAEQRAAGQCLITGDAVAVRAALVQQSEALTDALGGEVAAKQRLRTGQTACYAAGGAPVPCGGTGQDGEWQAGLTRQYTDNGDGTITDTRTGLTWEKLADDGGIHDKDTTFTWRDAFAVKIAALNTAAFAGHTDWRLPKVRELQTLVDYGAISPSVSSAFNTACAPGCTVQNCSCTKPVYYWSATPEVPRVGGRTQAAAWFVSFEDGIVYSNFEKNDFAVRAVRGSP